MSNAPGGRSGHKRAHVYEFANDKLKLLVQSKRRDSNYEVFPATVNSLLMQALTVLGGESLRTKLRDADPTGDYSRHLDEFVRDMQITPPDFIVAELGKLRKGVVCHWALQQANDRTTVIIQTTFVQAWHATWAEGRGRTERSNLDFALFVSLVEQFCHIWILRVQSRAVDRCANLLSMTLKSFVQAEVVRVEVDSHKSKSQWTKMSLFSPNATVGTAEQKLGLRVEAQFRQDSRVGTRDRKPELLLVGRKPLDDYLKHRELEPSL